MGRHFGQLTASLSSGTLAAGDWRRLLLVRACVRDRRATPGFGAVAYDGGPGGPWRGGVERAIRGR
jgi:hypothetical protein